MTHRITIGDVAARFGVSRARVRQLDDRLRPRRDEAGFRVYELAAVECVEAERRAAAERLSEERRPRAHELADGPGQPFQRMDRR